VDYWENPNNRMHEVEAIMKLTATYVPTGADNGVPSNFSIGFNDQPNDFAQGYGMINAQKAVALALTLQEMRRTNNYVTLMDAYYRYFNITTEGLSYAKTNVLATGWKGDWSQITDPLNPLTSITTKHPREIVIPNNTARIILDLIYEPISTSDFYSSTLWVVIDYNGDGTVDWSGDSSFNAEGRKHDEIEVGGGGGDTGQPWEFNVGGRAAGVPRRKGFGMGENQYNEAIIGYTISVQLVLDVPEGETIVYETGDYHARIAQPEFGEPTPEFHGNGSIAMPTMYFDLTQIAPKEAPSAKKEAQQEFPWWAILVLVIVCGLIAAYYMRSKGAATEASAAEEGSSAQEAIGAQQASQVSETTEVVEVEAVPEEAPD
jgi:hypothetical protein